MTMVKVQSRVEEARAKLRLLPGESMLCACASADGAATQRLRAADVGGFVGRALARHRVGRPPDNGGRAATFPSGNFYVCLTNRRMVVTNVVAPAMNPTRILAAYDKDDVISLVWDEDNGDGEHNDKVIVAFADGTAVKFPVAHNSESECLPEKFLEW